MILSTTSVPPTLTCKRHLEEILKDTKILCELEPFVKKWSISEILPKLSTNSDDEGKQEKRNLSHVLKDITGDSLTDEQRESIFRKVKEMMALELQRERRKSEMGGSDQNGDNLIPCHHQSSFTSIGDQYDRELESTLQNLEDIERTDAVTEPDIANYIRGCDHPDGPNLHKSSLLEWKNVFIEHWLHLNKLLRKEEKMMKKMSMSNSRHKGLLPYLPDNVVPKSVSSSSILNPIQSQQKCSGKVSQLSRANLDCHFTTKKGNKNMRNENNKSISCSKSSCISSEKGKSFGARCSTSAGRPVSASYSPESSVSLGGNKLCPTISLSSVSSRSECERKMRMGSAEQEKTMKVTCSADGILMMKKKTKSFKEPGTKSNDEDHNHHHPIPHQHHDRDCYQNKPERQRLRKCNINRNAAAREPAPIKASRATDNPIIPSGFVEEGKICQNQGVKKGRNLQGPSVRPSSAVPYVGVPPKLRAALFGSNKREDNNT